VYVTWIINKYVKGYVLYTFRHKVNFFAPSETLNRGFKPYRAIRLISEKNKKIKKTKKSEFVN